MTRKSKHVKSKRRTTRRNKTRRTYKMLLERQLEN